MTGKFILSLDFELHWGGVEIWNLETKKEHFRKTVQFIPEMLKLFEKNDIKATWATVGFLFAQDKKQLISFLPSLKPSYNKKELTTYAVINSIGNDEKSDPYHFAPSLIDLILRTRGQELASHTFSHYYCNEEGQTVEQFDADLKSAQAIAEANYGMALKSLVFPKNQFNKAYLAVAHKNGIRVVRSNPDVWFWNNRDSKLNSLFRAIDTLIPISKSLAFKETKKENGVVLLPASRFFRAFKPKEKKIQRFKIKRIKNEMTYAAKHNRSYHLWWHPHNMAHDIENNRIQLKEIIAHFKLLERKYNFKSASMDNFIE